MKKLAWWMHVLVLAVFALGCAPEEEDAAGVDEGRYETAGGALALVRSSGDGRIWTTIGKAPDGMVEEARFSIRATGEIALFACWTSGGLMPSHDPSCEGHARLGVLGYLNAAAGVPLYRCRGSRYPSGVYHFPSTDARCHGRTLEGLLGYVDGAAEHRAAAYLEMPTWSTGEGEGSPGGIGGGDGAGGGMGAGGSL
ncbi:MAG: hypothetical protein KIT84_07635 [Labilithrix sp.]|nr:hypothetical protein [Labilithrix sp.]MCW5810867.1 hypothetical protein [Labilithrix sp.]